MIVKRLLRGSSIFLLFTTLLIGCSQSSTENLPEIKIQKVTTPAIERFGLKLDTLIVEESMIKKNQTFAQIMDNLHIDSYLIREIQKWKEVFNPSMIRSGSKQFIVLNLWDSIPLYWIYEPDPKHYIRIKLFEPVDVRAGENKANYYFRTVHGEIRTSLWNTATELKFPYELALELSEIYAWTIDFFDLKKGDCFDVLYEEEYIDSVFTGISRIFAARFTHEGTNIYAIPFVQDSIENYFDLDGESLKRTFLKTPLRFSRISSRFSYSRLHPILRIRRPHPGVDYAAPLGTPVHTVGDGKVIYMKQTGGAGKIIKIRHNSIYTTGYLHLRQYAKGMYTGKKVKQGDIIGYVGSTGLSTGPHLDFRFYKNGSPVDPLRIKSPPVIPVKQENKARFDSLKQVLIKLLDTVE
ncbi:MAG: peptidoglycan DD-metalloendopeptidase family protein [Chlorobi bacterium]|nr:peptidoglycan DD-metalloendopeptidase family protein [Chlorobiota bacterium]